jgi:hypothetical protein
VTYLVTGAKKCFLYYFGRFYNIWSYSVSCGLSAAPAPVGTGNYRYPHRHQPAPTGTDRHRPALTGLDRHKTDTDRPGLFYDVFDKNFQNIMLIWGI